MHPPAFPDALAGAVVAERTVLRVPSLPELIEPTVEFLRHKAVLCGACQGPRAGKLLVALQEALSNAVVHGNLEISSDLKEQGDGAFAQALAARAADDHYSSRLVEIQVDYDGERCRWAIQDQGRGFDVTAVLRRLEGEPDTERPSGRGILLMRAFLDEVRYEAGGRRLVLTLHRASGREQRREERVTAHAPVQIAPVGAGGTADWDQAYPAVCRNVSGDGMAVLQAQVALSGRILIGVPGGGEPVYFPAEVRHWREVGDGLVEFGCRFQPPAPAADRATELDEAIGALLQRGPGRPETEAERRAHPRLGYTERIQVYPQPDGPAQAGFARDLSRGGMAFISTSPLRGVVVLELSREGGRPLRVRAEVVRCTRIMDGFHDVGVRFLTLEAT